MLTFRGLVHSQCLARFSGVLTLEIDATQIEEGQKILLFQYDEHEGEFSSVSLVGCNVEGTLDYFETQLIFSVEFVSCDTLAIAQVLKYFA